MSRYPNIVAIGRGYVVTDDHSGGLVFPRHPVGAIRQAAYGRGIRTDRYGFQRDRVGGNRIPKVGLERRVIGLGRRTEQPAEPLKLIATRDGMAAVRANKPAKPADVRPGAIAKRAARAKRAALAAREQMAREFNDGLLAAARQQERNQAMADAAAQRERAVTINELATRLNNGVR